VTSDIRIVRYDAKVGVGLRLYDGDVGTEVPLRVPRHRVDPNAAWLWVGEGVLSTAFLVAALIAAREVTPDDVVGWLRVLLDVAPWLAVPLGVVLVVVEPLWRYRVHHWEVTGDAVYTLEGWLTRTWRIVPIARIQTVDTTRGPVQQLFGLATVTVRTASHAGSTEIQHLDAATADAVAHDLALRANAVRDEVT
jgi:membrane protein YdbS with pleckstrin-like domain